jgi:hypothetical protein
MMALAAIAIGATIMVIIALIFPKIEKDQLEMTCENCPTD